MYTDAEVRRRAEESAALRRQRRAAVGPPGRDEAAQRVQRAWRSGVARADLRTLACRAWEKVEAPAPPAHSSPRADGGAGAGKPKARAKAAAAAAAAQSHFYYSKVSGESTWFKPRLLGDATLLSAAERRAAAAAARAARPRRPPPAGREDAARRLQCAWRAVRARRAVRRRVRRRFRKYRDEEFGAPFYFDGATGESSWLKPAALGDDDLEEQAASGSSGEGGEGGEGGDATPRPSPRDGHAAATAVAAAAMAGYSKQGKLDVEAHTPRPAEAHTPRPAEAEAPAKPPPDSPQEAREVAQRVAAPSPAELQHESDDSSGEGEGAPLSHRSDQSDSSFYSGSSEYSMLSSRSGASDVSDQSDEHDAEIVREQLIHYFEVHNPENVCHVDEWIAKFGARQLLEGLRTAEAQRMAMH